MELNIPIPFYDALKLVETTQAAMLWWQQGCCLVGFGCFFCFVFGFFLIKNMY